jgi:aspartyl-tRNA synthetase
MDFTNRRQSTNVDDRRKNWRVYEAFRPVRSQPEVVADNRHTLAVERAIDELADPPVMRRRRPEGSRDFLPAPMSQGEFDGLLDDAIPVAPSEFRNIIGNLLRK